MILDENGRHAPATSCRMVSGGHGEDDTQEVTDYSSVSGKGAQQDNTCHQTNELGRGSSARQAELAEDSSRIGGGLLVVVDVESTGSDSPYSPRNSSGLEGGGGGGAKPPSSAGSTVSTNCSSGSGSNIIKSPKSGSYSSGSSSSPPPRVELVELGNKCGKCQNHEIDISKKGHARDCPFKKCDCRKCRLLDARSDILQVISGKETKLKGTKKDPNCGFCQNHGVKILRKGHVRSCGFGQERHFKLDNCFDCEVHYIRNEVNRLQIKMRRAMKEDRTLSEEQRKTAREAITRDEVEKVCDMARLARKKRESMLTQQAGESSMQVDTNNLAAGGLLHPTASQASSSTIAPSIVPKVEHTISGAAAHTQSTRYHQHQQQHNNNRHQMNQLVARQTGVWRPWSQHQVAAAMAAQQHQNQLQLVVSSNNHTTTTTTTSTNNNNHHHHHPHPNHQYHQHQLTMVPPQPPVPQQSSHHNRRSHPSASNNHHRHHQANILGDVSGSQVTAISLQQANNNNDNNMITSINNQQQQQHQQQQQQLTSAISQRAMANQTYLMNSLQAASQQQQQQQQVNSSGTSILGIQFRQQPDAEQLGMHEFNNTQQFIDPSSCPSSFASSSSSSFNNQNQFSPPPSTPPPPPSPSPPPQAAASGGLNQHLEQPLQLTAQRSLQEQQLFDTLFRLIVAQFAGAAAQPPGNSS